MEKNYFYRKLLYFIILIISINKIHSQATFADSQTAAQIAAQLQSDGVVISNGVITRGLPEQLGAFSNALAAGFGIDNGVAFTTSSITDAFSSNSSTGNFNTLVGGTYNDMDLIAINNGANNDVVVFEFDFVASPNYKGVLVEYQFGSEEYPDYVGSGFNDVFGFFVSDPTGSDPAIPDGDVNNDGVYQPTEDIALNLAIVPGTTNSVSVNTVNAGFQGSQRDATIPDLTQSAFYINNGHIIDNNADPNDPGPVNTNPGPFPVFTEFNGVTTKFGTDIDLIIGVTYHMKIAIADVGDGAFDSGVIISGVGGTPVIITDDDAGTVMDSAGGTAVANVLVNDTVGGTTNPALSSVDLFEVSSTNAGVTLNTTTGAVEVAPGTAAGVYTLVYNACKPSPTNCSTSNVVVTVLSDNDFDGVEDNVDLDDDNDGILDTVECPSSPLSNVLDFNTLTTSQRAVLNSSAGGTISFDTGVIGSIGAPIIATITSSPAISSNNTMSVNLNGSDRTGGQSGFFDNARDASGLSGALVTFEFSEPVSFNITSQGHNFFGNSENIIVTANVPLDGLINTVSTVNNVNPTLLSNNGTVDTNNDSNPNYTLTGDQTNQIKFSSDDFITGSPGAPLNGNRTFWQANSLSNLLTRVSVEYYRTDATEASGREPFQVTISSGIPDSDRDGIPDCLDLDSDNDGCSDANEAYANSNADGGDGGQFGTGSLTLANGGVNADGTVANAAATYPGTNANVISAVSLTQIQSVQNTTGLEGFDTQFVSQASASEATSIVNGTPVYGDPGNADLRTTYQWFRNGTPIDGTTDGGVYSEFLTRNLTIAGTPQSLSGNVYSVEIRHLDNVCSFETSQGTLTVVDSCNAALSGLPDFDNDGVSDVCDQDDDNDGITDTAEGFVPATETTVFTPVNFSTSLNSSGAGTASGNLFTIEGCDGDFSADFSFVSLGGDIPDLRRNGFPDANAPSLSRFNTRIDVSYAGGLSGNSAITYTFSERVNVRLGLFGNNKSADGSGDELITFYTPFDAVVEGTNSTFLVTQAIDQPAVWHNENKTVLGNTTGPLYDVDAVTFFEFNNVTSITLGVQGAGLTQHQIMEITDYVSGGVCPDFDLDTQVNYQDTDSDNDGCPDASEASNNIITGLTSLVDGSAGGSLLNLGTAVDPATGIPTATGSPQAITASVTEATRFEVVTAPVNEEKVFGEAGSFSVVGRADTATSYVAGVPTYGTQGNADSGINYQWYIGNPDSGGTIINGTDTNYTDFTTSTLNIGDVSGLDATNYCVLITHDNNICIREINCATLTVTNLLVADADDFSATPIVADPLVDTAVGSVIDGDTLNGVAVTTANTDVTPITDGILSVDTDGNLTVVAGTPSGTYTIVYEICEVDAAGDPVDPANCAMETATVVVTNPLVADADDFSATPIVADPLVDTAVGSVIDGDTLNGVQVTTNNTDVTPVTDGPLSVDTDGNLTVVAGTPSGTYTIAYQVCEVDTTGTAVVPANCATETATVVVTNPLVADADDFSASPVVVSATMDTAVGSVIDGDTLNGVQVTTDNTDVTPVTDGILSVDADGNLTVVAGTPSGTYTIAYEICEVDTTGTAVVPANCATETATVVVTNPIEAVDDTLAAVDNSVDVNTTSVFADDTFNGVAIVVDANGEPTEVTLTGVTVPIGLTLNDDGTITVAAGTTGGTYVVEYMICENEASPVNCSTAEATVVVTNPIVAVTETFPGVNGMSGGDTASVLLNDTLNGVAVVPADITLTAGTAPTPIAGSIMMNADGTVTVAPGTTAGTYLYEYTICENLNPSNCSTIISEVVVDPAPIVAVDDSNSTGLNNVNGYTGGVAGDVTSNDTLDGVLITDTDVIISVTDDNGLTGVTIAANGDIIVPAGSIAGTYILVYQICEVLNTDNCDSATATVIIDPDNDGDGVVDSLDIDDDNDGVLDTEEGNGTVDTDNDGIPDSLDTDSDNDGVLDIIEANDADGNGIPDVILSGNDIDGDGLDDAFDTDNGGTAVVLPDTDGDGILDYQDTDDDNDGILTIDEGPGDNDITTNDSLDTNDNGIPDYLDTDRNSCGTPYNIMTPDNDGINDSFFISCIDKPVYKNNTVEIFNRWGNTVYKVSGYNNNDVSFKGISNGRSTISVDEKLPAGTYYYVIDLGDGSKPKVGWLYINR